MSIQDTLAGIVDAIETTSWVHRVPLEVVDFKSTSGHFLFCARPEEGVVIDTIMRRRKEFALQIGAPEDSFRIFQEGNFIIFSVPKPQPDEVRLSDMIAKVRNRVHLLPGMMILGLSDNNSVVVLDLCDPTVTHLFVGGTTGAGKTMTMYTVASSMASIASPDDLILHLIDPKGREFEKHPGILEWPHTQYYGAAPPYSDTGLNWARTQEEIDTLLGRSVQEMDRRNASNRDRFPEYVILVDEALGLSRFAEECLSRIAREGRTAHLHLVVGSQHGTRKHVPDAIVENFPARLVLKVVDHHASKAIGGRPGLGGHLLRGKGDGVLVVGGQATSLQIAECDIAPR